MFSLLVLVITCAMISLCSKTASRTDRKAAKIYLCWLLSTKLLLGDSNELSECGHVIYGKLSKHFTVYGNTGKLKTVDETAVADVVHTSGSIDTGDPKPAEIAATEPAADVSIAQSAHNSGLSGAVQLGPCTEIALGKLKHLAAFL